MKRRVISFLLALVMVLTLLPTAAFASESASGTCGENLTWELSAGTLTISGTGAMEDYMEENYWVNLPPWDDYSSSITKVVIGSGVTTIGAGAFYSYSSITSVVIGRGVTTIGDWAFYDCGNLATVEIPDSITNVEFGAFWGCFDISSVYITDMVAWFSIDFTTTTSNPLMYADSLYLNGNLVTNVSVPSGVTEIKDNVFYEYDKLTSVAIPASVTSIGTETFSGCENLTTISFEGDAPTNIESMAFRFVTAAAYYPVDNTTWTADVMQNYGGNITWVPYNTEGITIGSHISLGEAYDQIITWEVLSIENNIALISCDYVMGFIVYGHTNKYSYADAFTPWCESFSRDNFTEKEKQSFVSHDVEDAENQYAFILSASEFLSYYPNGQGGYRPLFPGVSGVVGAYELSTVDANEDLIVYWLRSTTSGSNWIDVASYAQGEFEMGSCANLRTYKSVYGVCPSLYVDLTKVSWVPSGGSGSEGSSGSEGGSDSEGSSSNVSGTVKGVYGSKFTYSDRSFFTGSSSTTYNHELAIASCNLAIAAFNASGAKGENYTEASAAANVRELLARLGFSAAQVETGTYAGKPTTNSIAAAIASKEISDGDETWTLLTVAVRGGGYEAEWGGNFNVGSSGAHEGFDMAAGKVCQAVMDYVETHNVGGKVAVWITGYSRGAAVANRVASALSGGYLGEVGCYVNANDVYAYTFETPMASLNTDSVARKNIFNIVNATDIVAKVAPSAWGFGRYGTDVVFPTAEMSSIFGSSFESYLSDAETYYADFTDGDVLPKNFKAYKLDYQNGVIKMVEDKNSFRMYHSFFVDEFVNDSICGELFASRSDYADSWEEVVVEAATSLNAAGLNLDGLTTAGLEELADEIAQYILDYLKEQGLIKVFAEEVAKKFLFAFDLIDTLNGEKKREFFEGLSHILVSAGVLTVSEEAAADMLDDAITLKSMKQLLEFLLKNFEEIYTLVKNLAWVEVAHEPQFCLAWLLSTPEMMMKESQTTYRIIGVNCPVDVRVYDSNGVLVAAIINDQVQEIEGSTVSAIIDENGQKIILLPADEEYRVETTATADGTMSYSVTEYDAALGEKTRVINYYDMVLDEGTKYTGTVENLAVESAQYPLQTESGNVVPVSEELRGEEISSYVVTVTAEANGYVSGGGAFTCGEYAKVSAIADEGAEFRGWYSDGELVSEDAEYRFRVSKDTELTAKFDAGVTRIFGADRYETAFKTAEVLKRQLGVEKFNNIVVACGDNFADALGGSYLAAKKNAPILLVKSSKIDAVKSYIKANLNPGGTVYLLGGTAAIPSAMDKGLDGFTVRRLAGATRYDTNLLILEEAGVTNEDILICTGKNFADSLSAAAAGRPILLVKDSLNDSQKAFLQSHAANKKYILGGTAAVSTRVENQAKAYGTVERIGGNTRYETSVLIAKEFFPNAKQAALAYAQNFPDGLSGGALAYAMKAPLVLTASGKEAAAAAYAKEQGITSGVILGGNVLISDKAARTIFQMKSGDVIKIG